MAGALSAVAVWFWQRVGSGVLERGFSLVDEGVHAFLLVRGRKQRVEHTPLEHDAVAQRSFKGTVDRLLG